MGRPLLPFAGIALGPPVPLLALGALEGGVWAWLALGCMTALAGGVDLLVARISPAGTPDETPRAADAVSVAVALAFFGLLAPVVHSVTGGTGLPGADRTVLFVAAGFYFGQVANANAHGLIHRASWGLHTQGKWVYVCLLLGHATSAHLKVHHRWAASPRDLLWPRGEEGFYAFLPRAWVGSFRAGWAAEDEMRAKRTGPAGLHPHAVYLGGGAVVLFAAWAMDGGAGVGALVALAALAQAELFLSDYVQHYGLRRAGLPGGRLEPMRLCHNWNARHWFTSLMTLNASRHSDHHAHPSRPYPALTLPPAPEAPQLPFSLQVIGLIALVPPLWRAMTRRELAHWRSLGARLAQPA
jgi:alkane 1-monooxygenase